MDILIILVKVIKNTLYSFFIISDHCRLTFDLKPSEAFDVMNEQTMKDQRVVYEIQNLEPFLLKLCSKYFVPGVGV